MTRVGIISGSGCAEWPAAAPASVSIIVPVLNEALIIEAALDLAARLSGM